MQTVEQEGEQLLTVVLLETVEPWSVLADRPLQREEAVRRDLMLQVTDLIVASTHSQFERSETLVRSVPQILDEFCVPLRHVTFHAERVRPETRTYAIVTSAAECAHFCAHLLSS